MLFVAFYNIFLIKAKIFYRLSSQAGNEGSACTAGARHRHGLSEKSATDVRVP